MKSDDGRLVPLDTLAKVTQDAGPLTIHHLGQLPSVTISFNLRPGESLGEAVDQFNELTRNLPATISGAVLARTAAAARAIAAASPRARAIVQTRVSKNESG